MSAAHSLHDLEALDHAALKAMIMAQQERYRAELEQHTAMLNSRTSEIKRLMVLVEKLQRMLFGSRSEKVLRQIEQLELQLEKLHSSSAIEELKSAAPAARERRLRPIERRPLDPPFRNSDLEVWEVVFCQKTEAIGRKLWEGAMRITAGNAGPTNARGPTVMTTNAMNWSRNACGKSGQRLMAGRFTGPTGFLRVV
jgi:hypothetical protein